MINVIVGILLVCLAYIIVVALTGSGVLALVIALLVALGFFHYGL